MTSQKQKSLGYEYTINSIPESYEEFDSLAKKDGAALAEAINNVIYRGCNSEFRSALVSAVEETTGVVQKSVPAREAKDGEKPEDVPVKYTETEAEFLNRVVASGAITQTDVQELANSITIVFDPSQRERKAPEARISKAYLKAAQDAIAAGKGEKLAAKLSDMLNIEVLADETSLAKALIANKKRVEAEANAALGL